jgi:hypothetical protein
MKTKTWQIIPLFYQPIWDPEEEVLIWDEGSRKCLELPEHISTEEEAEEFLEQSALEELGTPYFDWIIREW